MTGPGIVLGLRALGLGDFCTAVPAWCALRRAHPEQRTVLAAPAWQRPLVDLCTAIDELLPTDELAPVRPGRAVSVAVNLHGRGPESTRLLAVTDPERLVAFAHPSLPEIEGPAWDEDEHEVARWCRLVGPLGGAADAGELGLRRPSPPAGRAGATVLHAGASAAARRWPVERWAQVADELCRWGHDVVLTGSADERHLTSRIRALAHLEPGSDLAGRTDLAELAGLVGHARLVVSGDTGTGHLASAFGTPSVVLFGPTAPTTWGPPTSGPHQALWTGSHGDPHGARPDPGLLAIDVAGVLGAIDEVASAPAGRRRPRHPRLSARRPTSLAGRRGPVRRRGPAPPRPTIDLGAKMPTSHRTTSPPSQDATHLIGGVRRDGGPLIDVHDPGCGDLVGRIPAAGPGEVAAAVAAARRAQPAWAGTAPATRAGAVRTAADRLRDRTDRVADLQSREGGKPLAASCEGVMAGIAAIEQYAEVGPLHRGQVLQGEWGATDLMVPVPIGVAAVIVPWNDPVAVTSALVAAVLVSGNAVVLKPSERTPLCSALVAECFDHLPDGVVNVLQGGPDTGAALVDAPVDVVVHTGSVATGREIAARCAPRLVKTVLELGGKDAMVVDDDVDPSWAADQAATGAFANAGQLCTSIERIYVHRSVAEPFLDALVARAGALRVGPALDPDTDMGPLIDRRQRDLVARHVEQAVTDGARVLAGGGPVGDRGWFYAPTVVVDVPDDTPLFREETFGPVAAVQVVDSFEEGLVKAAASPYGLAAVVLTGSHAHAQEAWRRLPVGTVKVNAVFGGAPGGAAEPHGVSGWGFGYGPELLDEITRTRVVHLRPAPH